MRAHLSRRHGEAFSSSMMSVKGSVDNGLEDAVICSIFNRSDHLPDALALDETCSLSLAFGDHQLFDIPEFEVAVKELTCRFGGGSEQCAGLLAVQVYASHASREDRKESHDQGGPSGEHYSVGSVRFKLPEKG